MTTERKIPSDGWVLVGDGHKALLLQNTGDALNPSLKVQRAFEAPSNPRSSDQGSDRPGRAFQSIDGRRAAMEASDLHDAQEHRFARTIADALDEAHRSLPMRSLVLVAPPRALADLRRFLTRPVTDVVTEEINKDLTHFPVREIERYLCG